MSLKDQVAADLDRVFLNADDFAETHLIEGTSVICVVNEDTVNQIKEGRIVGHVEADMIIFGKTAQLPPERGPESIINVDGKEMIVVKWAGSMGLTEIALRQNLTM